MRRAPAGHLVLGWLGHANHVSGSLLLVRISAAKDPANCMLGEVLDC